MPDLSIGEIAGRAGIRPSAIRYYERVGLLPKPPRARGRRRYDETILDRMLKHPSSDNCCWKRSIKNVQSLWNADSR